MAKTKKQKSMFTPFRISVSLNILLSIIVIAGVGGYLYLKNAYNNGEQFVAEWGTVATQNYCSNADQIQKNKSEFVGYPTEQDKKRAFLALNTFCDTDGTWGPYYQKALTDYYKDNGVEY
jgi:hypothetical protein